MASAPRLVGSSRSNPADRNRKTMRVLLVIVAVLVIATILVGIRW